jgi:glycosyltransferase A (GT-A) superfamily protein (DUF2064 family)
VSRGILIVFARRPEPGRVKTRLTPPLRPEQAAALYAAMLDDVLEASAGFAARFALDAALAVTPPEACDELARRCPAAFRIVAQRGPDLGARMEAAVEDAAAAGASPILLRGSDSPALDAEPIGAALSALFAHPMGTGSALSDTVTRAGSLGLRVELLEPGFDIDTVDDLRLLAAVRRRVAALCPRTLAYLDAQQLWPDGC